jgi:Flp pilus assembly protein TadD
VTLQHADTLLQLGRHEEALKTLSSLGDDEGDTAFAHSLRARALLGLGKNKEADDAAADVILAAPEWEMGYRLAAVASLRRGRTKDARKLAREAVRVEPDEPYAHYIAAITALQDLDATSAMHHATTMLRLAPNNADAYETLGRCQLASGRRDEAEASVRKALELDPQDAEAMSLLADVVGKRDQAQATQLRVAALRSDPHSKHHRSQLLKRGGFLTGGGLFVAAKLGLVGKLALWGALRTVAHFFGGAVVVTILLLGYVTAFTVTRLRRWSLRKEVSPLVWEGLRADRRNADLLWLAWPAGLVLVFSVIVTVVEVLTSNTPSLLLWLTASAAVLATTWALRQGDARQLTVLDVLRRLGRGVRTVFGR